MVPVPAAIVRVVLEAPGFLATVAALAGLGPVALLSLLSRDGRSCS
jgi:hypothetical protein